jgi:hypothetical protein
LLEKYRLVRLLAPQQSLTTTVEKQDQEQKQKYLQAIECVRARLNN